MNTITEKEIDNLISNCNNDLAYKLMKSEFYTPIRMEKGSIVISTVSDDENVFIRLFDCLDDYNESKTELEAEMIPFEVSFNLLRNKIDGFIININSKDFILDEGFIKTNLMPYSARELKDINDSAFCEEEQSIKDSVFLTLLLADEDYSAEASEGIISAEGKSFEMGTFEIDGKFYHLLFTSKSHLTNAFHLFPDSKYYSQIIDLADLIVNFREENIDGVLIDFPDKFKCIPTENLSRLDINVDIKLRNSLDYVFEI